MTHRKWRETMLQQSLHIKSAVAMLCFPPFLVGHLNFSTKPFLGKKKKLHCGIFSTLKRKNKACLLINIFARQKFQSGANETAAAKEKKRGAEGQIFGHLLQLEKKVLEGQ